MKCNMLNTFHKHNTVMTFSVVTMCRTHLGFQVLGLSAKGSLQVKRAVHGLPNTYEIMELHFLCKGLSHQGLSPP